MLKYMHMDEKRDLQIRVRLPNPKTRATHKKEFRNQVLIPLILTILISVIAVGVLIYYGVGSIERWSQIASIFLIMFWMVIGLLLLTITVGLIFLISRLLQLLPPYTRMAQDGIETIKHQVESGTDITVRPVIKIQSFLAVIDALLGRR
jgi:uncharacterized protein involved in cysteine biosynthesis